MVSVKEYIQELRDDGWGLYEAMDKLDNLAYVSGYNGPAFYHVLCDVYSDWEYKPTRKHRLASKIPPAEWQAILERYNHRCIYCGKRKSKLTKDHVIPISQNGEDDIDNIVPACWSCNFKKRARDVADFKEGVTLKLL